MFFRGGRCVSSLISIPYVHASVPLERPQQPACRPSPLAPLKPTRFWVRGFWVAGCTSLAARRQPCSRASFSPEPRAPFCGARMRERQVNSIRRVLPRPVSIRAGLCWCDCGGRRTFCTPPMKACAPHGMWCWRRQNRSIWAPRGVCSSPPKRAAASVSRSHRIQRLRDRFSLRR